MPYVRKAYRKRPYTKRRPSVSRGKPPVPRKRKTSRSYIRANALATRANARSISRLFSQQYGPVQRSLQYTTNTIVINNTQPAAFDAADFTSQRTNSTGTSNNGCTIWQVNNLLTGITNAGYFSTATHANNALWNFSNKDIVDGGRYKPLYATYEFEITGRQTLDSTYIQLDLFTQKAGFQRYATPLPAMSNQQRIMPDALVNMGDMTFSNSFNPSLFKHYKRMKMLINSQVSTTIDAQGNTSGVVGTTSNVKYFRLTVRPKKARQQLETSPDTPGDLDPEVGQTAFGSYGSLNVDPRTPLWIMLSTTDRTALDGDAVMVKIKRQVVWRDVNGGTRTM